MDINSILTSEEELKVIDSGAWVGDLDDMPGVKLKVIGMGSSECRKAMERKLAALRKKNKGKELTAKQINDAATEVAGEVALKDWSGLKQGGRELPFSRELAVKFVTGREGEKVFRPAVFEATRRVDEETAEFVEEVSKNS